jgi:hypothetical protein
MKILILMLLALSIAYARVPERPELKNPCPHPSDRYCETWDFKQYVAEGTKKGFYVITRGFYNPGRTYGIFYAMGSGKGYTQAFENAKKNLNNEYPFLEEMRCYPGFYTSNYNPQPINGKTYAWVSCDPHDDHKNSYEDNSDPRSRPVGVYVGNEKGGMLITKRPIP